MAFVSKRFASFEYNGQKLQVKIPTIREWTALKEGIDTEEGMRKFLCELIYCDNDRVWDTDDQVKDSVTIADLGEMIPLACDAMGLGKEKKS